MRLDKYLSNLNYTTRRQAKKFLKTNEVKINNVIILDPSTNFNPEIDEVYLNDEKIIYINKTNICLYKPKNVLSANKDNYYETAIDLINLTYRDKLKIAGRLDLDAEGLLILTTDGNFVHNITHPKKQIPKVYEVKLDKDFTHEKALLDGVILKDDNNKTYLAKAQNIVKTPNHVKIIITEGKFHQVKRMFKNVGYEVLNLKRVQIGNLTLRDLKPGEHYFFEEEEL